MTLLEVHGLSCYCSFVMDLFLHVYFLCLLRFDISFLLSRGIKLLHLKVFNHASFPFTIYLFFSILLTFLLSLGLTVLFLLLLLFRFKSVFLGINAHIFQSLNVLTESVGSLRWRLHVFMLLVLIFGVSGFILIVVRSSASVGWSISFSVVARDLLSIVLCISDYPMSRRMVINAGLGIPWSHATSSVYLLDWPSKIDQTSSHFLDFLFFWDHPFSQRINLCESQRHDSEVFNDSVFLVLVLGKLEL